MATYKLGIWGRPNSMVRALTMVMLDSGEKGEKKENVVDRKIMSVV